jgi:putative aldouronate transport system permease protein
MTMRRSRSKIIFDIVNALFLGVVAASSLFIFIHILALSLSDNTAIIANEVALLPRGFNFESYRLILSDFRFWNAFGISIQRVLLGILVNMTMIIITAYPLSKTKRQFKMRNIYMIFFFITSLFSGGIIAQFVLLNDLGLLNTIWSLVLPTAVPVFNIILMLNFYRQIPPEIIESAEIDGANEWQKLVRIIIPLAKPAIATVLLFTIVGHWNSWFDGLLFSTSITSYPLQSYLQTVIIKMDFSSTGITDPDLIAMLSNISVKSAQIIIAMIPVLLVYPFVQRFFITGIVIGSVKE